MKNKEIIIIGAGVCGLATAIALSIKGFKNITIYERRKQATTIGAGLVLWANASKILYKLDILGEVEKYGGKLNEMQRWTEKNEFIGAINVKEIDNLIGFPSFAIARKDLQEILINRLNKLKVRINYHHVVKKVKNSSVIFENELEKHADIILGADGRMNSMARKYVYGNNKAVYQNFVNWIGILESEKPIFAKNKVLDYWGIGERFGIVSINKYKGYWAGAKALPLNSLYKKKNNKLVLKELFGSWSSEINQIIHLTKEENIKYIEVFDHHPLQKWYKNNVYLLGDAAHSALPTSGQGACQAIEDAYHFANILSVSETIETAFEKFQNIRLKKTTAITMAGRDFAKSLFNTDSKFCMQRNENAKKINYKNASIGIAGLWSKNLPE